MGQCCNLFYAHNLQIDPPKSVCFRQVFPENQIFASKLRAYPTGPYSKNALLGWNRVTVKNPSAYCNAELIKTV